MLGLIAVIERFNSSRGVRFETIAITRIRASVMDELWRWMRARYREMKLVEADLGVRNQVRGNGGAPFRRT
jgi:DNA-directed RNA polymerase specialized sigma subunit